MQKTTIIQTVLGSHDFLSHLMKSRDSRRQLQLLKPDSKHADAMLLDLEGNFAFAQPMQYRRVVQRLDPQTSGRLAFFYFTVKTTEQAVFMTEIKDALAKLPQDFFYFFGQDIKLSDQFLIILGPPLATTDFETLLAHSSLAKWLNEGKVQSTLHQAFYRIEDPSSQLSNAPQAD